MKFTQILRTLRTKAKRCTTPASSRRSLFDLLPEEVIIHILSQMGHPELMKSTLVCTTWNRIATDEVVWRQLYIEHFENHVNKSCAIPSALGTIEPNSHRASFVERYRQDDNWKKGKCTESMLYGHTGTVWCLQFDDERIISGSFDKTIKIWDSESRKCKATLRGHYYPIQCLHAQGNVLITGSLDNSIRAWELPTSQPDQQDELQDDNQPYLLMNRAHNFDVFCLQFKDSLLVTGSSDNTVKIWQMSWGTSERCNYVPYSIDCRETLRVNSCVTSMQFEGDRVVTGSANKQAQLWDMHTGQAVATFSGHTDSIRALQFTQNCIVTGSNDSTVKVWDLRRKEATATLRGHKGGIRCLKFEGSRLVTGSTDQTVRLWDLNSGLSYTMLEYSTSVTALGFHKDTLAAGFNDNRIKLLSF